MKFEKEFNSIETLTGDAAIYFNVPLSLIKNKKMHAMRVSLFAYLSVYRGVNNRMCFSVKHFLKWAGYKSDRRIGGINDKVLNTIINLKDLGFIQISDDEVLGRTTCFEIAFNRDLVYWLGWQESFAILYWDEVQKIMTYKNENTKDRYFNGNTILLVFAYLRQAIFRLPNTLKPEERSPEGIAERRKRCIEAYNGNYKSIAKELGLSERMVSRAVKELERLKLIITAEAYHIENEDGKYITPDIIFANTYKRENKDLLRADEDYALYEISKKEKSLQQVILNYRLRRK